LNERLTTITDHPHDVSDAVLEIVNMDGSADAPVFRLCAFDDGCYEFRGRSMFDKRFSIGCRKEGLISKILQDAGSFGFQEFPATLHLEEGFGPDLELTIRTERGTHTVKYTPIVDDYRASLAVKLGPIASRQLFVTHLLGERVLDLASEVTR
jgi:hypothetical protein